MQLLGRALAALLAGVAVVEGQGSPSAAPAAGGPPTSDGKVDFSQHGGDWSQGNCASRNRQSPIDLVELFKPPEGDFHYFYMNVHTQSIVITNDGRTISVDTTGQGFGGVDLGQADGTGTWFNLKRIDFKARSEHTIRGRHKPLEVQLVHQASNINDPTYGNNEVIVSVLLGGIDDVPEKPEVFPGLLQRGKLGLRGRRGQRRAAASARQPQETDANGDDGSDETTEWAENRARDNADVDYFGDMSRVAGQAEQEELMLFRRQQANVTNATNVTTPYKIPAPGAPNFNPTLNFFLGERPPAMGEEVTVNLTVKDPLQLGHLLKGGTFFMYTGSETLPPCTENVVWLVRRDHVPASEDQIKALFTALFGISNGAGNYRTIMPLNNRDIPVMSATEREPGPKPFTPEPPQGPPKAFDDGREGASIPLAKDAITISKAAADYAKDLDQRLLRASMYHDSAYAADPFTTTPTPDTTPPYLPKYPLDVQWSANKIGQLLKSQIEKEVWKGVNKIVPAATNLAMSYARQQVLESYGFTKPPMAPGPAPSPALAR